MEEGQSAEQEESPDPTRKARRKSANSATKATPLERKKKESFTSMPSDGRDASASTSRFIFPHDRTQGGHLVMVCTLRVKDLACGVQRTKTATGCASGNTCKDGEDDVEGHDEDVTFTLG